MFALKNQINLLEYPSHDRTMISPLGVSLHAYHFDIN